MVAVDKSLSLEPHGDGYLLRRTGAGGDVAEIKLSEANVITLAQSARQLTDRILARRSRPGADAVSLMPVEQIELNMDLHRTCVHLTLIDSSGARVGFSLSPLLPSTLRIVCQLGLRNSSPQPRSIRTHSHVVRSFRPPLP